MESEEDEFWTARWSDTCGVCGNLILEDDIPFEIRIKKVWDDKQEEFFRTQVCKDGCVDKAFDLLARNREFKRSYKFSMEVPRPPDDYEKYECSNCETMKTFYDRHILVRGEGPYGDTFAILEHVYCSYKCYKESISLGYDYMRTMLNKRAKRI
jgi:hypothetical protein